MNTANKTPNSDIADIIAKLKYISLDKNQDLKVNFKGYTHGKTGFILQIEFIEIVTEQTIDTWKNISDKYLCEIDLDYNNRTVNLYFEPIPSKALRCEPIVYLSFILICIWILFTRHSKYLMQNYTKVI